jgi:hypothetical protein
VPRQLPCVSPPRQRVASSPHLAINSPFDDAEPGELAGEGWSSDADWGFRGPGSCRSSPSPPRAERGHLMRTGGRSQPPPGRCQHPPGTRKRRHASISPANLHRRNDRLLTFETPEDKDFAAAQGCRSPPAEGLTAVGSSPSPTGLVFGPFSALRSLDDADPGELAGEGWNSDADWGFRGPESGRSSPSIRRYSSISPAPPPSSSHRLRTLSASLTVLRPLPVSQQTELGVGSNGEGSDFASSLVSSNRVQGSRKRLSSDCEPPYQTTPTRGHPV